MRANLTAAFAPGNLGWRLVETRVVKRRAAASPATDAIPLRYNFGTTEREKKRYAAPQATPDKALGVFAFMVRDQGVGGSNPLSPTISNQLLTFWPKGRGFTKRFTLA
jgi:hypothetical protein